MKANRTWAVVVGVAVALFAGAYFGSPYLTAQQLRSAAHAGDRDKLEVLVDFPAVRESLKADLSAQMLKSMQTGGQGDATPFAALGMMLAPALTDRMVDSFVTPAALASIVQGKKPGASNAAASGPNAKLEYLSLDRFRVTLRGDTPVGFILARSGLFRWRLVRVNLPEGIFDKSSGDGTPPGASATAGVATAPASNENTPTTTSTSEDQEARPVPLGGCGPTTVASIGSRLEGAPDSGSDVSYANGVNMVAYDVGTTVADWQVGDPIQLCLTDVPKDCPPNDNRGATYSALNLRTHEKWSAADSEHACGGA